MNTILPFDEINALEYTLPAYFQDGKIKPNLVDTLLDALEDLFLLSYALGSDDANRQMNSEIRPTIEEVMDTVDAKVAGKTWRERVREYAENGGTPDDIAKIIETESHRDSNEAALTTARKAGAKTKTWMTMLDDRVRETHDYLQSMTVGINEPFFTFDGDSAQAPGGFGLAENNVNCRCVLTFS